MRALTTRLLAPDSPADRLASHVRRSPGVVRVYAEALQTLRPSLSEEAGRLHDRWAAGLLEQVCRGENVTAKARVYLDQLQETDGADLEDLEFATGSSDHRAFVKGLEKAFKVKVHHHDPVGTGVYVYLDSENTDKLRQAIESSLFDRLVDDLGYILLRRGKKEDSEYGSFGDEHSLWIFAQVIRPDGGPDDQEGKTYSASALKKLERAMAEALRSAPASDGTVVEFSLGGRLYEATAALSGESGDFFLSSLKVTHRGLPVDEPAVLDEARDQILIRATDSPPS